MKIKQGDFGKDHDGEILVFRRGKTIRLKCRGRGAKKGNPVWIELSVNEGIELVADLMDAITIRTIPKKSSQIPAVKMRAIKPFSGYMN